MDFDIVSIAVSRLAECSIRKLNGKQDQSDDGRIGSSRDGSTGGTIVNLGTTNSSSLKSLGSTFIPVLVYSAICFAIFLIFRRKYRRVYAPRTIPSLRTPE